MTLLHTKYVTYDSFHYFGIELCRFRITFSAKIEIVFAPEQALSDMFEINVAALTVGYKNRNENGSK